MVLHRGQGKSLLKGLAHDTQPLAKGSKLHPSSDNPPACAGFYMEEKKA
jgi:hypothetical protein